MKRKWVDMILGRLYDLALWPHPWPWPWSFKVRVWNSFISGMGQPIDNERKGCESSTDWLVWPWWGGRMYRIVTRVTSDIGMPSTYLVTFMMRIPVLLRQHVYIEITPDCVVTTRLCILDLTKMYFRSALIYLTHCPLGDVAVILEV